MRILCLHGFGTSGEIFKSQTGKKLSIRNAEHKTCTGTAKASHSFSELG